MPEDASRNQVPFTLTTLSIGTQFCLKDGKDELVCEGVVQNIWCRPDWTIEGIVSDTGRPVTIPPEAKLDVTKNTVALGETGTITLGAAHL